MHEQELEHKAAFDKLMADSRVRPTMMLPFWNIAGFALGKFSLSLLMVFFFFLITHA
jgi:ubiquinone biosynthesis monooxygenase Coq7